MIGEPQTNREWTRHVSLAGALAMSLLALAAVLLTLVPGHSRAAEIIPSYGVTKSMDADDAKGIFGLALHGSLVPHVLKTEIAAGYRTEEMSNGAVDVRQWPITASLLLTPVDMLYAGVGVGWYHTTYDYESDLIEDDTTQEFGVHVGGGLQVPVSPRVAVDLGGRFVKLQDQESRLVPEKFDPSFWTLSLGLALKF